MTDMPATTKHIARRPKKSSWTSFKIRKAVIDWLNLDNMAAQFGKQAGEVKTLLRDTALVEAGEEDDKGNAWIDFSDDPIPDPSGKGMLTGVKREKRTTKRLLEEQAEALLKRKGLWDECTETVVVLNEDAILAAAFENRLTEAELQSLYEVKETFAFVPQRIK